MRNISSGTCRRTAVFFLPFLLFAAFLLQGEEADGAFFTGSLQSWSILAGYGQSVPGWGETSQRVETLDIVPRYNRQVLEAGSGWYQGYYSVLVELPLHLVARPDTSVMLGMNFLACYTFTAGAGLRPYVFGGGGPVYSFADIPGMGAELNGNYQFGIGLAHPLSGSRSLLVELRYHHISNGGSEQPNAPLNSGKLLVGVTF